MSQAKRPIRIAVLAFDGCMSSAVVGLLDAFHLANRALPGGALTDRPAPRFEARIAAASPAIAGSSNLTLHASPLRANHRADVAIVPPMLGPIERALSDNPELIRWIAAHAARGGVTASVCAGAFFLGEAGLLAERRATTNPAFGPALHRAYPSIQLQLERRVVDEGRVLTAGSTTAFLDLAIHLIERFAGHEIAVTTAKALSIDKNHRSQLPYFLPFADRAHADEIVVGIQAWLEENFAREIDIEQLARRAAVSQRSLNRRFRSATGLAPLAYLHRLRIEAARRRLETSRLNVQEITMRVGYQDARSFSRLFRSHTGLTPGEYRARFGQQ